MKKMRNDNELFDSVAELQLLSKKNKNILYFLLRLISKKIEKQEYLDCIVRYIQQYHGISCVGLRFLNEKNCIPYESYVGFSQEFWEKENFLSIEKDQCSCVRIFHQNPDPIELPYVTQAGSYHCGDIQKLVDLVSEKDVERFRGSCLKAGYATVAVIPIRYRNYNMGILHLADWEPNKLNRSTIEFLELIVPMIAEAFLRFKMELEMKEHQEIYLEIIEKVRDCMFFVNLEGRIVKVNNAAVEAYGYSREEFNELSIYDIRYGHSDKDSGLIKKQMGQAKEKGILFETIHRRKDGSVFPVEVSSQGATIHGKDVLLSIVRDVTERKEAEERLLYAGTHDSLTRLYSRSYFEGIMQRMDYQGKGDVGLIVCDLDGLKLINDTLGHEYGDQILISVGRILEKSFRAGDVVARIGGDEFAVILEEISETEMEKFCEQVHRQIDIHNDDNQKIPLSLSIGFAMSTKKTAGFMKELFKEADNRMYREKLHRGQSARSAIVQTLMKLLEARDFITEGHADRLQDTVSYLGKAIGMSNSNIADLRLLAQFHDIGKVGIPDRILKKPGALTAEERMEMCRHTEIGHRIALASSALAPIADWILKHHEWWDGRGYPLGLAGESMPIECRILSIADAYDAMTNDRPYRKALPRDVAMTELKRCAGTQFDPVLVEKFCEVLLQQAVEGCQQIT